MNILVIDGRGGQLGEVTPKMAVAVGQADATRILLPMKICNQYQEGVTIPQKREKYTFFYS